MGTPSASKKCSCIKQFFSTVMPDPFCRWHGDIEDMMTEMFLTMRMERRARDWT